MTISLTLNDIPDYLRDSELYKNIESDESFDVPIELFKKELIINTFDDLIEYIKIFDYWMINKIPNELYKFVLENKDKINMNLLNDQFPMNNLIKQIKCFNSDNICASLAKNGYLECLKYAHENGCSWLGDFEYRYAAEYGHLDCLRYAHENGCHWNEYTCIKAAQNGHLDCLKYAYENGCEWDEVDICMIVAEYGHLECLKYAHENGHSWDENTCSWAAGNGQLECLKYAHENGCEWDEYTYSNAAKYGHLECLKYAHENGCPWVVNSKYQDWGKNICRLAASNGHLDCLKYAHEKLYF